GDFPAHLSRDPGGRAAGLRAVDRRLRDHPLQRRPHGHLPALGVRCKPNRHSARGQRPGHDLLPDRVRLHRRADLGPATDRTRRGRRGRAHRAGGQPMTDWLELRSGVAPVWARYTDLVVERGIGSWVETIDGERYLDYTCGIGVTNTGHAHPRVAAAIAEQAGKIIHAQQNILYHKPGLELHERLPRTFPGLRDGESAGLFLSHSGAEAIEASVKLAKYATRRPGIIAFRGGFHGRTHGTMALTSSAIKNRGHFEPLLGGVHFAPYPYVL